MKLKARIAYYNLEHGDKWSRLIAWLVYILAGSRLNHVHIEYPDKGIAYFALLYRGVKIIPIDVVRKQYGNPVFIQTVLINKDSPLLDTTIWRTETIRSCVFWHLIGRYFNKPVPHTCGKVTADILRDSGYPIPMDIIEPHLLLKEVTNANATIVRKSKSGQDNSSQAVC